MQKTLAHVLAFSALTLACKPPPSAPAAATPVLDAAAQERDAEVHSDASAHSDVMDGHGHGHGQESAACDASRCALQGAALARSFMMSEAIAPTVRGGDCARVDINGEVAGMACTCQTSNGWLYIGPKGAGCFARGRAGDCLWDDTEFEGCAPGDPKCSAACEELERRYAADAAKSFDVEVRSSTCKDGSCRHVLRIENACYTDRSIESGRRFDCQLSDSDILASEDKGAVTL